MLKISNFEKIRPMGRAFHTDGHTHMKLIVAFLKFANTPKNCLWSIYTKYSYQVLVGVVHFNAHVK